MVSVRARLEFEFLPQGMVKTPAESSLCSMRRWLMVGAEGAPMRLLTIREIVAGLTSNRRAISAADRRPETQHP